MLYSDLSQTLLAHYQRDKNLESYPDNAKRLKSLGDMVQKINRKTYIMDAVRLHILDKSDYHVYISTEKPLLDCAFSKMKLSDPALKNLLIQLTVVEKHNSSILAFLDDIPIPEVKCRKYKGGDLNVLYILISTTPITDEKGIIMEIKNYYDSLNYLFGKDIEKILHYQTLDRLKGIMSSAQGLKVCKLFQSYVDYVHTLPNYERDRLLIHSGSFWLVTGTTYTEDVDIVYAKYNSTEPEVRDYLRGTQQKYPEFDFSVIASDRKVYVKPTGNDYQYKTNWFIHILPSLGGAKDIYDVIASSKHHLTFLGARFFSLSINFAKFLQRADPGSISDLIVFRDINKYNVDICLPISTVRQGRWTVFNEEYLIEFYVKLKECLKNYYKIDKSIEELRSIVTLCGDKETSYSRYAGPLLHDSDTSIVKFFHLNVKQSMFFRYSNRVSSLLDIGSGKLSDLRSWQRNKIGNIDAIEPSTDSIQKAANKLTKFKIKNIRLHQGVGDEDWILNGMRGRLAESYDVISMQFCVHYMIPRQDILIKNLISVSRTGTKLLITCVDGNLVQRDIFRSNKKRIELRNEQEPIFGVAPLYTPAGEAVPEDQNIVVYFKGSYGLNTGGSVERILDINKLILFMREHNFKLLEKKNFNLFRDRLRDEMTESQKRISNYYVMLTFEYQ